MRVLIVTRQFPNSIDPLFSPFNRQQFTALGQRCEVDVLASIPWFPGAGLFARWSLAGRLVVTVGWPATGTPATTRAQLLAVGRRPGARGRH